MAKEAMRKREQHDQERGIKDKFQVAFGKAHAKRAALSKRTEGGMYGDAAMKRFTANKDRKHKQWDKEGK